MKENEKTVFVFGTFDGLHDGHRFFLRKAKKLGGTLIATVAQDAIVERIKGRPPQFSLQERLNTLEESGLVDKAVPGDTVLGNWKTVKVFKPDIVAIGYDQTLLGEKLGEKIKSEHLPIKLITIAPFEPDRFHSSLLREAKEPSRAQKSAPLLRGAPPKTKKSAGSKTRSPQDF
ncbi:MAG: hypothetical protein A2849_01765 [Candidatus Taylorbacteria bacterium RIFCSPHIGHO2_01_FULL_51_15]|uniref:Cytidyltransferase-like domain-containing protein n=1 Tax=Candidatus Taylorbacteria bacterium RIFCSPHIGHO2_01_FULL_51_15 TaxID=1802304 RepID=A0A1G2MAU3_9BACT|nr:MAG: hypothetical protein A2849_01765 [Candidatus Taylorbacteria bacterium RIFCSPHIGHO2_01_FULL_51_15]